MGGAVPPSVTWLVRHGQSTSNAGLPATGTSNVDLTDLGRRQAQELAARVTRPPDLLIASSFIRSQATAEPIRARWPEVRYETWPIHELTYLSPARCVGTTAATRRPWVDDYWARCDPDYLDGPDAESFRSFMQRLGDFHRRLLDFESGFVIAVGHGQFFSAYLLGLQQGFDVTADWMKGYRTAETTSPIANCEIIEPNAASIVRAPFTR
jgi:broad specificity phosphatase PhoE